MKGTTCRVVYAELHILPVPSPGFTLTPQLQQDFELNFKILFLYISLGKLVIGLRSFKAVEKLNIIIFSI